MIADFITRTHSIAVPIGAQLTVKGIFFAFKKLDLNDASGLQCQLSAFFGFLELYMTMQRISDPKKAQHPQTTKNRRSLHD